jgi:hypothetical protein
MANKVIYSVITIEYTEHNMGTDRKVSLASFNTKEEAIDYFQFYNREQAEYLGRELRRLPCCGQQQGLCASRMPCYPAVECANVV